MRESWEEGESTKEQSGKRGGGGGGGKHTQAQVVKAEERRAEDVEKMELQIPTRH